MKSLPYHEPGPEVQRVEVIDGGVYRRECPDGYGGRWIREGASDAWMSWQRLWREKRPTLTTEEVENPKLSNEGDYVELVGDAIPNHLRFDGTDVKARCLRCRRWTWSEEEFGQECRMPQPDGFPCGGRFTNPTEIP